MRRSSCILVVMPLSPKHLALRSFPLVSLAVLLASICSSAFTDNARVNLVKKIEFNRDVRPVLSKCLTCHGNDQNKIMAGLRLDQSSSATKPLASGKIAVVPGHPEKSAVVERIFTNDQALIMPPVSSGKTLTSEEKLLLKEWIRQGGEFKKHWAFVTPARPKLPTVKLKSWPKNGIDYFTLAKQEDLGLKPSGEATRSTLLRRVTLDLTGLPPTPEELTAFEADKSPNAYEKVVDRLLASPRYGERMAMDWMDYARYADSNGYQADYERFQWRWRDWVINAFNKNMPFDEFTIEQLAGDMLPNATLDQKIATGFNRNHRINTEGGVIAEEWRVETVVDRVETVSTVWLGLTSGCARCHDHKYDPLTMKEFYQLFAYFNNVPETGSGEERPVNHPPLIKAPYPEQQEQMANIDAQISQVEQHRQSRLNENAKVYADWELPDQNPMPSLNEGLVAKYRFGKDTVVTGGKAPEPRNSGTVTADYGRATGGIKVGMNGYVDLGDVGNFDTHDPFSYAAWVYPEVLNGPPFARMDAKNGYRGWDLYFQGDRPAVHILSTWPTDALKVFSERGIPAKQWTHIAMSYDGSAKPEGIHLYINGEEVKTVTEVNSLKGSTKNSVAATVGRRTGGETFDGKVDDLEIFSRLLTPSEAKKLASAHPAFGLLQIPASQRTPEQKAQLLHYWSRDKDPEYVKNDDQLKVLSQSRMDLDAKITTVMVMEEMPKKRDAYLLIRGQYDKHGDRVNPGIPKVLPPLPSGVPNNRLGLAKWLVMPSNPLTARVTVNRLWERFFGTGIVPQSEDFGTRTEYPTHPELLDWLGTELVRLKWDLKAMIKVIVMSATYRQSSTISAELLKKDPINKLLARGPRFRLPAEVIRDQALAVSGLLVEKIGGRSVYPYEPDGIWDLNFYGNLLNYKHAKDEGLYRRSLYTIWKRTAAPPNMTTFDAPSRELCRVRRGRTNTPLQALILMNDLTYVEAAKVLAANTLVKCGSGDAALGWMFSKVLTRKPSTKELAILKQGVGKRLAYYRANPELAKKLVSQGESKPAMQLNEAEWAAYTVTASALLNLDEAVTKE